jgi:hypothetical protein
MEDWLLPRWAVGSVRTHLDVEELILAVLLFDAIVLPTPDNDSEFARWKLRGWEPEEQEFRRINLGDLVYEVEWDDRLRGEWSSRWERLRQMGSDSEAVAYGLTPQVIAIKAWEDVFITAQQEGRAVERPVPIAWYPHREAGVAREDLGLATEDLVEGEEAPVSAPPADDEPRIERETALLFRREISVPSSVDPDEALDAAVRLASTSEFITARRAQFDWELKVAGQKIDVEDAIRGLRRAAADYNEQVTEFLSPGAMTRRIANVLVPTSVAQAAKLTGLPGAGGAAGWGVRKVMARFCPLNDYPDPATMGAALGMVQRRMSAVMTKAAHADI